MLTAIDTKATGKTDSVPIMGFTSTLMEMCMMESGTMI